MRSYCLKRMRMERTVFFRLLIAAIVVNCLCAAVCGALWKVLDQAQTRAPLIFSGVFLTLSLFLSGVYLRESDINQLFKKTVFGRALVIYGDKKASGGWTFDEPRSSSELMAEIDEEALHMDYECVSFALMRHWAVFYRYFNGNVYSMPVEKGWITRIWWEKADGGENSGFDVYVERAYDHPGSPPGVYRVWEQADIEALRQWSASQEKMYDEL